MTDISSPESALSQQLLALLSCSKLNQSLLNDELTKYINIIASRMAASSTNLPISPESKADVPSPVTTGSPDREMYAKSHSPNQHITKPPVISPSSVDMLDETSLASLDKMHKTSQANLDKMTATYLAYSALKNSVDCFPSSLISPTTTTNTGQTPVITPPWDQPIRENQTFTLPTNKIPTFPLPNIKNRFSSFPTYQSPTDSSPSMMSPLSSSAPLPKEHLPFPLDSYWTHTTPISDISFTVLPFATIARTLDMNKDPGLLPHLPQDYEVHEVKLLDLWGVLGWFALQYIVSAELLANNKNLLLIHLGE